MAQGPDSAAVVIDWDGLGAPFEVLRKAGYRVVGPTVRDAAIVLEDLSSSADLRVGRRSTSIPLAAKLLGRPVPRAWHTL